MAKIPAKIDFSFREKYVYEMQIRNVAGWTVESIKLLNSSHQHQHVGRHRLSQRVKISKNFHMQYIITLIIRIVPTLSQYW